MYSKLSASENVKRFACAAFIGLCCVFNPSSSLEAAGWGNTKEVINHEGVNWNSVYCNLDGIKLKAKIPNYSGAILQNNIVSLSGEVDEAGYVIITTYNEEFTPPKSQKEFVKLIQEANKSYVVKAVSGKKLGAKYAVDLIPAEEDTTAYWRFLSSDNRLIHMGTDDTNENRRMYFFKNISVK